MKAIVTKLVAILLLFSALAADAATTRYVDLNNPTPAPPFTTWETAATNIQDAIDAAEAEDLVLVTNGVYQNGATLVDGSSNRVAVTKPVTVQSVNGPEVTLISGYQVPGTTNGPEAVRCVYLASGAVLSGFMLTNGATQSVGDSGNNRSGGGVRCESVSAVVTNCVLTGNAADYYGGGVLSGTLYNCTLTDNSTTHGGGAYGSTLNNCVLTGNSASAAGGGANVCTLNNCTVTGNSAYEGGGASSCTLNNCIVYYNTAKAHDPNYQSATLNYCCTEPIPSIGTGNLAIEPQLASSSHLSTDSPCRGAGSAVYAAGVDIDGEPWATPPAIGCDEYWSGSVTGTVSVGVSASDTTVAVGFPVDVRGLIEGRVSASRWDFGDGVVVSNRPWTTHVWESAGEYAVELRAFSEDFAEGVAVTSVVYVVAQPIHYVSLTSTNPTAPYTNWVTAATNIQDAVDASIPGAMVLVSNGVYQTGARAVYGMSNRVAVTKPVTVHSVNGPLETIIQGYQVPGTTNGIAAIRCVYLTNGAVLSGFTLTNGATQASGDLLQNQSGGGVWCEVSGAELTNCVLAGNSAFYYGGGSVYGTLNNCTVAGNTSYATGGAFVGTLNNCTLTGNSAITGGGGASGGTLNNCTLTGNATLLGDGGGVAGGTLNNCFLTGNCADSGGGASYSTLNNCTLAGNAAYQYGGGTAGGTVNNCIVYYNTAGRFGDNYYSGTFSHSCTTPMPAGGEGNLTAEPQLADKQHLNGDSPCRGAGKAVFAAGLDLDGEMWANPPSIGCDEYWSGSVTGNLSAAIVADYTNVAAGFAVNVQALTGGRISSSRWDFGDGVVLSNRPWATHAWSAAGEYFVELWANNESNPAGVSASIVVMVVDSVHHVALTSTNPVPPYTNWLTAATSIQDAVDVATLPGALVLVSNGVYQVGARAMYGMSNRVAVTKPLVVRSVNGPASTVIRGYQVPGTTNGDAAIRCVYLTNGAVLTGFTLTNGATQVSGNTFQNQAGGGVWCETLGPASVTVSNCVLTGNAAYFYGGGSVYGRLTHCNLNSNSAYHSGGGAYDGTLDNCTLTGNFASSQGGGSYNSRLNNCTIVGNWSENGGGVGASTLYNCIVYYNRGSIAQVNNFHFSTLNYCCTTPMPSGAGNLTGGPMFLNTNGWSDLRLQVGSPCIDKGNNTYSAGSTDMDGYTRIMGGKVDMGAYESLDPFHIWLAQHGLSLNGSADLVDTDGDGMNNHGEWRSDTNPTNALSVLKMVEATNSVSGAVVTWQSVATRNYWLERATNLGSASPFEMVATNIFGGAGTKSYTDSTATNGGPYFYRVGVQ